MTPALALLALLPLAEAGAAGGPEPVRAIRVRGDPEFRARAADAVERIRRTSTGARLLRELERAGGTVTVRLGGQESVGARMLPTGGGDSVVLWDPEHELPGFPAHLFLYHELVHALHEARGERKPYKEEERRALGVEEYAAYPLSENALRRELGLPPRRGSGRADLP